MDLYWRGAAYWLSLWFLLLRQPGAVASWLARAGVQPVTVYTTASARWRTDAPGNLVTDRTRGRALRRRLAPGAARHRGDPRDAESP
jgi:hypothetical protein